MGKLINRIPGSRLLISSLPGSALRTHVESLGKPRDVNKRLKALPGKLDIKRHSPSIFYFCDFNAHHYCPKIDELRISLAHDHCPDIFGMCETFLTAKTCTSPFQYHSTSRCPYKLVLVILRN